MSFSNTDNVIDSRDVIERMEELRDEANGLVEAYNDAREELDEAKQALADAEEAFAELRDGPHTAEQYEAAESVRDDASEHLEDVQGEYDDALSALADWFTEDFKTDSETLAVFLKAHERQESLKDWSNSEDAKELVILEDLNSEGEDAACDWSCGETLIRDDYFTDYCKELLEDCGEIPKNMPSYIVIDWEATAANLRHDYTEVDFDGVAYLVR